MTKTIFFERTPNYYNKPEKSHEDDAGYDIYVSEEYHIEPGETKIIPTGIRIAIPENHFVMVVPRSGLSLKTQLRVANSPGIVDTGYRDEVGVIIHNVSFPLSDKIWSIDKTSDKYEFGNNRNGTYVIPEGSRIAQLLLINYIPAVFREIEDITKIGKDRGGGFGSTGT